MSLQEICIAKHNEKVQQRHQSEEEYKMHHAVQLVSLNCLLLSLAFSLFLCIPLHTLIRRLFSDSCFKKVLRTPELWTIDSVPY